MDHASRASTLSAALTGFLAAVEQGLYDANALGSGVRMPVKVRISGIYSHQENQFYALAAQVNPAVTKTGTQTNELAIVVEEQATPIRTSQTTVVHPQQVESFAKAGSDRTEVTHDWQPREE